MVYSYMDRVCFFSYKQEQLLQFSVREVCPCLELRINLLKICPCICQMLLFANITGLQNMALLLQVHLYGTLSQLDFYFLLNVKC